MRVAVVAEYYPRPSDPAWGIWAHRQALAVRDLGVDVRVLALERPLPPLATCARCPAAGRCATGSRAVARHPPRRRRCSTASRSATCASCRRRAR